jgi:hypothetical protein
MKGLACFIVLGLFTAWSCKAETKQNQLVTDYQQDPTPPKAPYRTAPDRIGNVEIYVAVLPNRSPIALIDPGACPTQALLIICGEHTGVIVALDE